jgi:hypothetical protein
MFHHLLHLKSLGGANELIRLEGMTIPESPGPCLRLTATSLHSWSKNALVFGSGFTADHQAESLGESDFPDDVLESEEVFSAF